MVSQREGLAGLLRSTRTARVTRTNSPRAPALTCAVTIARIDKNKE